MDERETPDWALRADRLAAEAIAEGRPTAWFDRLYAGGAAGDTAMPWDRDQPHPVLAAWTADHGLDGTGRRAVVVGCGLGADAEHLAGLGFATTGFDVSATAVGLARSRHPGTRVDYRVGDLLDLPDDWRGAFDLVVEVYTVQALPDPPRGDAVAALSTLVAPGGTLLAVALRDTGGPTPDGPPWPLDRSWMERVAGERMDVVGIDQVEGPLWRGEYRLDG